MDAEAPTLRLLDTTAAPRFPAVAVVGFRAMVHTFLLAVVGLCGGALGSVVGLGGGVFIIPILSLFLKVPIHSAISASLVAVVATSSTAAAAYVREDLSNMRLGMTMETMTVSGALLGGLLGAALSKEVLSAVFGGVMVAVSLYMALRRRTTRLPALGDEDLGLLGACYYDRSLACTVSYRPRRLGLGMVASLVAGNVSGLLGVGGGFLKVPVMVLAMGVPVRAAVCTSSFMIGVTACAGAIVYFARGLVDPVVAVPVVLGVTVGAYLGSRLALRVRTSVLGLILAG
ncbi:MAG: sulfite exporter TauE/SafE family protein, partial [Thermoleophilia bacterium]|nr:sulfite exporter TauE/SafE family protein [Thermoleophilia bacterium]